MLKSVLFYLMLILTAVRFADIILVLTADSTNLPMAIILISSLMVVLGIALVTKKFVNNIKLNEIMLFYIIQAVLISTNLFFVSAFVPLSINFAETFVVGSFLDLLIDAGAIYACVKHMRSDVRPFVRVVGHERA